MKLDDLNLRPAIALPPQAISEDVLREKYAKGAEKTVADVRQRIARALAQVEAPADRQAWEQTFTAAQEAGFIPGGRIYSAAGTDLKATLDQLLRAADRRLASPPTTRHAVGIYDALQQAAETMRRGGGVGYDFSPIRPAGAWVKRHAEQRLAGRCRTCACSTSRARRSSRPGRGAARRWASCAAIIPTSRRSSTRRMTAIAATSTSPSPCTQDFMEAVDGDRRLGARASRGAGRRAARAGARQRADGMWIYRTRRARELVERRSWRSTYDHAEPGVMFVDTMNRDNNLVVLRDDRREQSVR